MKYCRLCVVLGVLLTACGCLTRSYSNTPRTALEQLLISGAVDEALAKFHVPELAGKKVHVDFTNLEAYDAAYIKVATRAKFAREGATLVEEAEGCDYVAEVASGGLGTEFKEGSVGIPAIPMPGSPVAFPELPLYKNIEQTALMKLLIFVHAKGEFVASAQYYAKCDRDESFILFFRFESKDDVREGWERADLNLKRARRQAAVGAR